MTIKFQNTKADYNKMMGYIFRKGQGWRWYVAFIFPTLIVGFGIFAGIKRYLTMNEKVTLGENGELIYSYVERENIPEVILPAILLVSLGIFLQIWRLIFKPKLYVNQLIKRQPNLVEPSEIIISNDGIEIIRTSDKAYMEWSLVKAIYERPEFFAILFNAGSFIPVMRKHLSEQEYQELKKLLQEKKGIE